MVLALLAGYLIAFAAPSEAATLPWVSFLRPTVGKTAAGTRVDVYGSGFVHVMSVRFANTPGTAIHVFSATHLAVTSPAHSPGIVHVQVRTAAGASVVHAADRYTFVPAPTITRAAPNSGSTSGGTIVTISGASFRQVRWVMFGTQYGYALRVLSPSSLQVTAPPGTAGLVPIRITTAFGTSSSVPADDYTYVAPATVTKVAPDNGTVNGGTVVELTGTDFSTASSVTFDGVPGTNLVVHSSTDLTVTTPPHAPGAVGVQVVTAYGTSVGGGRYDYVALYWSGPKAADPRHGAPQAVSCPTTTFCATADAAGSVLTFNGSTWSVPTSIDPAGQLMAISCPSPTFCAAIDNGGRAMTSNGSAWSTPTRIAPWAFSSHALSCVSATFCMAIDDVGEWMTFNGAGWSSPIWLGYGQFSADGSVVCLSATSCVAIDGSHALTFNGTTWSSPVTVDAGHTLFGLSCPSTSLCLATDTLGNFFIDQNGSWSAQGSVDPTINASGGATGLSCASSSFCVATEWNGDVVTYDGSHWSAPTHLESGPLWDASCASPSLCVVVDRNTHVFTYIGGSWSTPLTPDPDNGVTGLSCASRTFCAAVDHVGEAVTFDGTGWSTPTSIDGPSALTGVSCPSSTFCVAVGGGDAVMFDGATWAAAKNVDGSSQLMGVSCPTSSFCVAVDSSGGVLTFINSVWSAPMPVDSSGALTAVSCPTTSFCMALDTSGAVLKFDGVSWTAPAPVGSLHLTALSCASPSFCGAADSGGDEVMYSNGVWSASKWTAMDPFGGISCPTTTFCVMTGLGTANEGDVVTWFNGSWAGPYTLDANTWLIDISCPSASFCLSIDATGRAYAGVGG